MDHPTASTEGRASFDTGVAGTSARREHERRRASREERIRERHPLLGGAILALSDEPQHQRAWDRGARGEERVAAGLAKRVSPDVVLLHDRRIPGSRANIDHIAVAPSGVWVIDAKRYKGKVSVAKPLFGDAKLLIGGRERTKLIDGLAKQVAVVRAETDRVAPEVPVHGTLCFVDADLPLRALTFRGFPLLYPRALAKRLNGDGPLERARIPVLAAALATAFPPA